MITSEWPVPDGRPRTTFFIKRQAEFLRAAGVDVDVFHFKGAGKPCVFGHTPTAFLPILGRLGRHGIYISHSAIGIDTGYNYHSPLSCLSLPDFTLYQSFADGEIETHHITTFIPEELQAMRKAAISA